MYPLAVRNWGAVVYSFMKVGAGGSEEAKRHRMNTAMPADARAGPSKFSLYHNRRVALFLGDLVEDGVLRGTSRFATDDQLGNILRIVLDGPQNLEIVIAESEWRGVILPDERYGCDFCLILGK